MPHEEPKNLVVGIDVVICTYERADELERALSALCTQQDAGGVDWSVLVVDNNSSAATGAVVERYERSGRLPGIRRVVEMEQGLTPARRRGVAETAREWVAFVDDDNIVQSTWIMSVAEAIRARQDAGAIGGRVVLEWAAAPPSYLRDFGFCFAEQDHGPVGKAVDHLNGAGVVLRRQALIRCGWVDEPLLADRVGRRLTSGGDVEIALRVRSCGYELWYEPRCVLAHHIARNRMSRSYLLRTNVGLGASEVLISLMTAPDGLPVWRRAMSHRVLDRARWTLTTLWLAIRRRGEWTTAFAWLAYTVGLLSGTFSYVRSDRERRAALLGAVRSTKVHSV